MSASPTLTLTLQGLSQTELEPVAIEYLSARDASGAFAILPGHAAFATVLSPGLIEWRDAAGRPGCAGVAGGVLRVGAGGRVAVLARRFYRGATPDSVAAALRDGIAVERDDEARLRGTLDRLEAEATAHLARRFGARPDPAEAAL